jgi:hypothetical protein
MRRRQPERKATPTGDEQDDADDAGHSDRDHARCDRRDPSSRAPVGIHVEARSRNTPTPDAGRERNEGVEEDSLSPSTPPRGAATTRRVIHCFGRAVGISPRQCHGRRCVGARLAPEAKGWDRPSRKATRRSGGRRLDRIPGATRPRPMQNALHGRRFLGDSAQYTSANRVQRRVKRGRPGWRVRQCGPNGDRQARELCRPVHDRSAPPASAAISVAYAAAGAGRSGSGRRRTTHRTTAVLRIVDPGSS